MIVLDASAALEWLLGWRHAGKVASQVIGRRSRVIAAPHLIDLEMAQVLRRQVESNNLSPDRAAQALDDWLDLDVKRYPHAALLSRIWELRKNLTAYDAAYIALAEGLDASLLTCDRKLARSVHRAHVILID